MKPHLENPSTAPKPMNLEIKQPPPKYRRRPMLIAAGVALCIVGGLGATWLAQTLGNTETVLVTSTPIQRGQTITKDTLTTIEIAGGQNTNSTPVSDASKIVGKTALVDIPQGSLISSDNSGDTVVPIPGQSIVGLALTFNQLPGRTLNAGDAVRLIDTPVNQGEPPATTPESFTATVFTTRFDEEHDVWIVDVNVPSGAAADIAARAATGRIALILDSEGK